MKRLSIFLLFCFSIISIRGQEYTVKSIPNPQTANAHAFVSNPDGILQQSTVDEINVKLDSLRQQTGTEVAVAVVNSIGYEDENDFATKLFGEWGIGKEKQDNGALIFMVMDKKRIVIRTGYGIEGILPDAISKRIIEQTIIPKFRAGDFDGGIIAGVDRVVSTVKQEPIPEEAPAAPIPWGQALPYAGGAYVLLTLIAWLWGRRNIKHALSNNALSTNLARYKVIKETNAANASIIGLVLPAIGFGIIVLLGSFLYLLFLLPVPLTTVPAYLYGRRQMNKARRAPIPCNECGNQMHILSEKEENTHLQVSQQFEEQLNAVDYDVFVCDHCKNQAIFSLDKMSSYSHCPRCNTKAFILDSKKTVVAPTYLSSGTQRTTYKCRFCGYEEHTNTRLPRLRRSNSGYYGGAIGGGMFSGRGGFGGGGFGGGFGGGMTGGGGASGGW